MTCNASLLWLRGETRAWRYMPVAMATAMMVATSTQADFIGLSADSYPSADLDCCILELFACFDDPDEVLLNVFSASLQLIGAPQWFQSDTIGTCPAGGSWFPQFTVGECDSFLTIGGEPGIANSTQGDPSFDRMRCTAAFTNTGWFNSNPPNLQGAVDADGKVLIGRFVLDGTPAGVVLTVSELTVASNHGLGTLTSFASIPAPVAFAYECSLPSLCVGDLNGDGVVDAGDLAILLGQWGFDGTADLNNDNVVNAADLAILLGGWGDC